MTASSMDTTIRGVRFMQIDVPLERPYPTAKRVITSFDPFVFLLQSGDAEGFGESLVIKGYTHEDPEASWLAGQELARRMLNQPVASARQFAMELVPEHVGVASAALSALDMLQNDQLLFSTEERRVPILSTISAIEPAVFQAQIEEKLAAGYRTFKAKVGFDADDDAKRVNALTRAIDGRAGLRIDANRGFSVEAATRFVSQLDADGIDLFEQPCGQDDWEGLAAVAKVSRVPIMLDESVYGTDDIRRAATMENIGFIKLKLKKIGSAAMLGEALDLIRQLGMQPVLGDGVATDLGCWHEACVASRFIDNAGEMNGFLKFSMPLFQNPMRVQGGSIVLPANYTPRIDSDTLKSLTVRELALNWET